jgi:ATP-dependent protease ClpP protease subunit
MKITNAADARKLLMNRRTSTRPRSELPEPRIDGATAVIRLFDPIDSWGEWWGMSAKELAAVVDALPANITEIRLLINSPGGDAFDGLAMVNVLRSHSARIVAVVQGLAASAASFIAASADETIMAPNSTMMIHCAWGVCVGNADDMVSMAGVLEQLDGNLADIYAAKAGGDVDEWRAAMKAETWYTATEAVDAGLADRIEDAASTEDGDGGASAQLDGDRPKAATEIADPEVDDWASEDSDALELLNV